MTLKVPPICRDPQEFPMNPECIDRLMSNLSTEEKAQPAFKKYLESEGSDQDKIDVAEALVPLYEEKRRKG